MRTIILILCGAFCLSCSDYDINKKDSDPAPDTAIEEELFPALSVSPEAVSEIACETAESSVELSNTGEADLSVLDLLIEGEGWGFGEALTFPFSLSPSESRAVSLVATQGSAVLRVISDDPDRPDWSVQLESVPDQAPDVEILNPLHDAIIGIGADVLLEASVQDDVDAVEDLSVEWVSSMDGSLQFQQPDSSGIASWMWESTARSDGNHLLELFATDSCGNLGKIDIGICQQAGYTVDQLDISTWQFRGAAQWDIANDWLQLTQPDPYLVGSAFQTASAVPADSVSISFLFYIGDGTGADGFSLTALDSNRMSSFLGGSGCGLGYGGGNSCTQGPALPGWTVEVDTYYNAEVDPTAEDHVAFTFDGDIGNFQAWTPLPEMEDTGWHSMTVEVNSPAVKVSIDGVTYIDQTFSGNFNFPAYVGFTAGTGGLTNSHLIDSLEVTETICEE